MVNAALGLYNSMPDRDYLERKFEALMGTPLLPGFVSKWLIGSAAIETGTAMGMVGVAALLISTALFAVCHVILASVTRIFPHIKPTRQS